MDRELAIFLARHEPGATDDAVWGDRMRLRLTAYLGDAPPPRVYTTSARAIVTRDESILVAEDEDGLRHILPGGRIEDGEAPETALRREIAEESGWLVDEVTVLGFVHFRHLSPKPADYRYPYPDFVQAVYVAEATDHAPDMRLEDDYVVASELLPVPDVRKMPLTPAERLFLEAACLLRAWH